MFGEFSKRKKWEIIIFVCIYIYIWEMNFKRNWDTLNFHHGGIFFISWVDIILSLDAIDK